MSTQHDAAQHHVHQHNPDGSWTPATPMGFVPGIDWEVYTALRTHRAPHRAVAYRGFTVLAEIHARYRWLLWARLVVATVRECGWRPGERVGVLR
jgi:hypothetical protein